MNSSEAPPPVEMWFILSATPAIFRAAMESPPPTTEKASDSATALAMAMVPRENGSISKMPRGPFQKMVAARLIQSVYSSIAWGPMSTPIQLGGIVPRSVVIYWASGAIRSAIT